MNLKNWKRYIDVPFSSKEGSLLDRFTGLTDSFIPIWDTASTFCRLPGAKGPSSRVFTGLFTRLKCLTTTSFACLNGANGRNMASVCQFSSIFTFCEEPCALRTGLLSRNEVSQFTWFSLLLVLGCGGVRDGSSSAVKSMTSAFFGWMDDMCATLNLHQLPFR